MLAFGLLVSSRNMKAVSRRLIQSPGCLPLASDDAVTVRRSIRDRRQYRLAANCGGVSLKVGNSLKPGFMKYHSKPLLLAILGVLLLAAQTHAGGGHAAAPDVTANAFAVAIQGAATAPGEIREIEIDDLVIDTRETTTGLDVEYRLYAPGATHWGQARFSVAARSNTGKELKAWYDEAASGKNIRKNITVTLFKSDKSPGRCEAP